MMNFYKTIGNKMIQMKAIEDGCWINMVNPTQEEINFVVDKLNIENLRDNLILAYRNNVQNKENSEENHDLEFIEKEIMSDIVLDDENAEKLNNVSEEELKTIA